MIGIIGAMEEEISQLVNKMENTDVLPCNQLPAVKLLSTPCFLPPVVTYYKGGFHLLHFPACVDLSGRFLRFLYHS